MFSQEGRGKIIGRLAEAIVNSLEQQQLLESYTRIDLADGPATRDELKSDCWDKLWDKLNEFDDEVLMIMWGQACG